MKKRLRTTREEGLTLPEMLVWLGVFAVVGTFIAVQGSGILSGTRLEQANQEVQSVILAAQSWRSLKGNYTGVNIKQLEENGYNINFELDGNNGVNLYDENVVISSSAPQAAQIRYVTTSEKDCNQLKARVELLPNITGETCTGSNNAILQFEL